MRTELRNELSPALSRAISLAKSPGAQSHESGAAATRGQSTPADSITSAGIDDNDVIFTIFPALTEVDSTNDAAALTS